MDQKLLVNKKQNVEMDSAASSGGQGKYMTYKLNIIHCVQFNFIFKVRLMFSPPNRQLTPINRYCMFQYIKTA
jgi:hypothetical protein